MTTQPNSMTVDIKNIRLPKGFRLEIDYNHNYSGERTTLWRFCILGNPRIQILGYENIEVFTEGLYIYNKKDIAKIKAVLDIALELSHKFPPPQKD